MSNTIENSGGRLWKRKAAKRDAAVVYAKVARRKIEVEMEKGERGIDFMTMESIARGAGGTRPKDEN